MSVTSGLCRGGKNEFYRIVPGTSGGTDALPEHASVAEWDPDSWPFTSLLTSANDTVKISFLPLNGGKNGLCSTSDIAWAE